MADIGTSAWWKEQADRLVDIGLDALNTKLTTGSTTPNQQSTPTKTVTSGFSTYLPYLALGAIAIGATIILIKR